MNQYLEPYESELIAGSEVRDGREVPDDAAMRIRWLTKFHLRKLGSADGGWSILYRDPTDGRLWEKTYPESSLHGGGPVVLRVIGHDEAVRHYGPASVSSA